MEILQETTSDWKVPTPNHVYIFGTSSMKAIGYIKEGTKVAIKFSKPLQFDRRNRTFVKLGKRDLKGKAEAMPLSNRRPNWNDSTKSPARTVARRRSACASIRTSMPRPTPTSRPD